jgi:hypothetical protein
VREYGYTVTERDPDRPWIVLGNEHRNVELEAQVNSFEWAHQQWPEPRWTVELDPRQLPSAWPP